MAINKLFIAKNIQNTSNMAINNLNKFIPTSILTD